MKTEVRVLIVDDDRSSATMLSEVVKRAGFKPVIVTKVLDALNVARVQTIHAAIIDVLLPKMSGVDLAHEFRKTKFATNPIILVSGVFKDKAFAAEAIKKSEAIQFLFKPFNADELLSILSEALADLAEPTKGTVASLLTRHLGSRRERSKAIEQLEELRGQDLPFVLGIVMSGKLSGDLNIFNENGEIFGVKMTAGMITGVDSAESLSSSVLSLIANGYLTKEDWEVLQSSGKRRFNLDYIVDEGLVSPHAVDDARHHQILYDLRSMVAAKSLQVNFVPTDDRNPLPKHAVALMDLIKLLGQNMDDFFPNQYLTEFYAGVTKAPFRLVCEPAELEPVWTSGDFAALSSLRQAVENGGNLEEVLAAEPEHRNSIYLCLHYLILSRAVLFSDVAKEKNLVQELERFRRLFDELNGKTADRVFEYFAGREVNSSVVAQKIYDEYVRSNHPDQLAKDAPPELVNLCRDCFQMVSEAHKIMIDDSKRAELSVAQKAENSKKAQQSKELTVQGLDLLRKGQFQQALESLKKAESLNPSTYQFLIQVWAEIKSGTLAAKPALLETLKKLENLPPDDRKSSHYFMAVGLVRRALGDATAATFFEKALQADSSFMEARRELNSLSARETKDKKIDLLTSDIGDIVSQLFRRKAE